MKPWKLMLGVAIALGIIIAIVFLLTAPERAGGWEDPFAPANTCAVEDPPAPCK